MQGFDCSSDFVREDVRKTYPFISPPKAKYHLYNGVVVDQLPKKRDTLPVKAEIFTVRLFLDGTQECDDLTESV